MRNYRQADLSLYLNAVFANPAPSEVRSARLRRRGHNTVWLDGMVQRNRRQGDHSVVIHFHDTQMNVTRLYFPPLMLTQAASL